MKAVVMGLRWLLIALSMLTLTSAVRAQTARVKLLGINDFHGQLGSGRELLGRPVGSAAGLAAYLRAEIANFRGGSLIVHAGDFVGGSPYASSLLQDEPAISFLNMLANEHCGARPDPRCNLVGTPGNHEFDEGVPELLRLLRGGLAREGPFLDAPWRGSRALYVCSNVLDKRNVPILPPYVIQRVDGVQVALIGAVLRATENIVLAEGLAGARFVDESEAINRAVREVRKRGVRAIVVLLHQGAGMIPYEGPTRRDVVVPESELSEILAKLDGAVDVVVSGHAHQFANAYFTSAAGSPILVTQAYSAGMAYADIELSIDRKSGEVIDSTARIVPTFADEGPGLQPAEDVALLEQAAEAKARQLLAQVLGVADEPVTDIPSAAGESALGNLMADAERVAGEAQIALVSQVAIRADVLAGPITMGRLLAVHPFGSVVVTMDLSGAQLRQVLAQQWAFDPPHMLQVSGLTYSWDPALPGAERALAIRVGSEPLRDDMTYRVAVNDFLGRGGGGFPIFREGAHRVVGPRVVDALRAFIAAAGGKARARIEARIRRL